MEVLIEPPAIFRILESVVSTRLVGMDLVRGIAYSYVKLVTYAVPAAAKIAFI
jgi:hypothetical protein